MTLVQLGEAEALKGHINYAPGVVVAVEEDQAYSPFAPNVPQALPSGGTVIDLTACPNRESGLGMDVPLEAGEKAAAVARGPLGRIGKATVVLVQGEAPGKHPLDAQLAPQYLRVFDENREVAAVMLQGASFPCSVILDNFDGQPGNEVAVVWASVAAGYTIGVTVFAVR